MNYLYFTWLQYLAQERQYISKTHLPWFFPSSLDVCLICNIDCRHAGHDRQSADPNIFMFPEQRTGTFSAAFITCAWPFRYSIKLFLFWEIVHRLISNPYFIVSNVFLPGHFIYYINKDLQIVNTIYLKLAILFKWSWISISSKWTSPHFY